MYSSDTLNIQRITNLKVTWYTFFFSCIHEYLDIYSEIRSENTTKLIETPFGGRFCGPIPPRRRVSLYQGIALSFYTDKNVTLPHIFGGIYKFINACKFCFTLFLKYLPDDMLNMICDHNDCDASYIEQMSRQFKIRIAEYRNHSLEYIYPFRNHRM